MVCPTADQVLLQSSYELIKLHYPLPLRLMYFHHKNGLSFCQVKRTDALTPY